MDSKFFRTVWKINGVGILILIIFATFNIVKQTFPNIFRGSYPDYDRGVVVGDYKEKAISKKIDLQHLLFEKPTLISNSNYYYSEVVVLDKELPPKVLESLSAANDISVQMLGGYVNVLFYKHDGSDVHTLMDDFGYVENIIFPKRHNRYNSDDENDKDANYILYKMASEDNNKDGRINSKDTLSFFISDLEGKNLKQITPDNIQFSSFWFSKNYNRIFFDQVLETKDKNLLGFLLKTRAVYYYDIEKNEFGKFSELEKAFDSIQKRFKEFK